MSTSPSPGSPVPLTHALCHDSQFYLTAVWCRLACVLPGDAVRVALMLLRLSRPGDMGVIVLGDPEAIDLPLEARTVARGLERLARCGLVEVVARRGCRAVVKITARGEVP